MYASIKVGGRKKATVVVLGQFHGEGLAKAAKECDVDGAGFAAAKRAEATGGLGVIAEGFPAGGGGIERVVVLGLGKKAGFDHHRMMEAGAALGRHLSRVKADTVELCLEGTLASAKGDLGMCGRSLGESLGILAFDKSEFRGTATSGSGASGALTLKCDERRFADGLSYGVGLSESVNFARWLSETPPNVCTPEFVAKEAKKLARSSGMKCSVIGFSKMEDEGLTGHLNVGMASENEPCLIRLEYTPERVRRGSKPAVLVGKTITYDSGGLSIKPPTGMRGMKRDMDGGANVLGAMHAIATVVKPRRPVVAYLCCAENSISDEAYRPDDIIEFANGVTVEVTNTDAEGRLVLADGLIRACRHEKPAYVVDMATLTGGVVVALGSACAGMWCDDDELRGAVESAAGVTGEPVWWLPCMAAHKEMMRSNVADIWNSAPVREAHPIQGAAFLSYFVDEGVKWCHLDIAGVHAVDGEKGPFEKATATGFGVRLLSELVDSH